MASKLLIGLSGIGTRKGVLASTTQVGKNEVANVLSEELDFRKYAFDLPLKQAAQALFGLHDGHLWNENLTDWPTDSWGISPNTIFQRMGEEGGKEVFHDDMWNRMAMLEWYDIQNEQPSTLNHITEKARWVQFEKPSTPKDFDKLLFITARAMFQLSDVDIERSLLMDAPLGKWPFTFREVIHKLREETIPAVLRLPPKEAWERFVKVRSTIPMIETVGNGPYGVPPTNAKGMVFPDNLSEHEAALIRARGGTVVHVCRELPSDVKLKSGHSSQKGIMPSPKDGLIYNDGTLEELRQKTTTLISNLGGPTVSTPVRNHSPSFEI